MKIAAITITLNDEHVLEQWKEFHSEYNPNMYKHFIVDNNSSLEYKDTLRKIFPDSILIERSSNGGTTGAYNSGIKEALKDPQVDSIMLIANDIKLSAKSVEVLHQLLFSDEKIGAVAPILFQKDLRIILAHGEILESDMNLKRLYENQVINASVPELVESECLPGGMNLVKRQIYETVGLQDETLFMYMDENDFFYRVIKAGFKLFSIKSATAAHCHINLNDNSSYASKVMFYVARNHIIVCKRYKSINIILSLLLKSFLYNGLKMFYVSIVRKQSLMKVYYYYLGLICGTLGIRRNFIYWK